MGADAGEFKLREIRPGETEDIVRMVVSVFEETSVAKNTTDRFGPLNGHSWQEAKADAARRDIACADVTLVAESAGRVVAMVTLRYDAKYSTGAVGHLAVAKDAQGSGLGRRMLKAALERMRADALQYASIEVLEQNPRATALYRSEGFEEMAHKLMMFRPL